MNATVSSSLTHMP